MKMANARAVCKLAKPPGNKTVRDFRRSSFGYWQSASIIKCFTEKKEKNSALAALDRNQLLGTGLSFFALLSQLDSRTEHKFQ